MIVDVAHEQDADGALFLRGQRLAPCRSRFGGDDALERALRIAFAGLVIEDHHDGAADAVLVVVMVPLAARRCRIRRTPRVAVTVPLALKRWG